MLMTLNHSSLLSACQWFFSSDLPGIKNILNYFDDTSIHSGSDASSKNSTKPKSKLTSKNSAPKGICCRNCHARITQAKYAVEVEGQHQHTVTNPNGITFKISLYRHAECHAQTEAMSDYSWFVGYEWRIVTCPDCQQHIGWSYQKGHSLDFYGLISDKLIDFEK